MKSVTDEKKEKQLDQLYELYRFILARFLEQGIVIDRLVGDLIAACLCPGKEQQLLLISAILEPELEFSAKIRVLETLLKLRYPILLQENDKMMAELEKIRRFRNIM